MDTDLGRQLGENLKQLRRERGLTLGQLAALAGLSKAMLSDMEKGGANPTVNTIWKLANGLKVPYTRLLEGEAPRRHPGPGGRPPAPDRGGRPLPGVLRLPRGRAAEL